MAASKVLKPFTCYVYPMNIIAETTPNSNEEFQLAQTGFGKRCLTMPEDMNHEEATIVVDYV